jgi:hypothetical protein
MSGEQQQPPQRDNLSTILGMDVANADDANVSGLVNELTGVSNIETKTDLNPNQMVVMTRAIWFAKQYWIRSLDIYTRKVMLKLLVSKGRGGRKDIIDALIGVFRFSLEKQRSESVKV